MSEKRREERAVYIISVAAELAGVHPQTLRIYERKGLLRPARTAGNTRRFSDRDNARLARIQAATWCRCGARDCRGSEAEMDPARLTLRSRQDLGDAQGVAIQRNHPRVEPEHVLFVLLSDPDGVLYPVLHAAGTSPRSVRDRVEERLDRVPKVFGGAVEVGLSPATAALLERAASEAAALDDEYISTEHLLLAMLEGDTELALLLAEAGLDRESVLSALAQVRGRQRVTDENPEDKYQALERYGRDLTDLARRGKLDPVIGRDDEIRRVIQVLSRRTKNNPVLIGEPGVGKTAIVEGLARRIVEG